jgi:hypothetical protein
LKGMCASASCSGHGSCRASGECECVAGWMGAHCENETACAGVSCGGHGRCRAGACACTDGWSGAHCETPPDPCQYPAPVSCGAHGSCQGGNCSCVAGWGGARCNLSCPAHATLAPDGRYCSDLAGQCVGPGGSTDGVNAKWKDGVSRPACRAECDANPACTGYTYASVGRCFVHGSGLDTDLGGGWTAFPHPNTTISGADSSASGRVCAAVAGRN